jgi:hemerythrin
LSYNNSANLEDKMILKWDDDILTGIKKIDNQHKGLFLRINELVANVEEINDEDSFSVALSYLKQYAVEHFETEAEYFRQFNYPFADEHLDEHKIFTDKIEEIEEKSKVFGSTMHLSIELNAYLINWWYSHLKTHDKKFALYLKEIGAL